MTSRMTNDQPEALAELRDQLAKKGGANFKDMDNTFNFMDDNLNQMLSFEEFFKGLREVVGMAIDTVQAQDLFKYLDKDNSGVIAFEEFLICIRFPMSQDRKDILEEAYNKMDKTDDGVVTIADLRGVYDASVLSMVQTGEWDENRGFEEFLKTFEEPFNPDGRVTKVEFFNFYNGWNKGIDSDKWFISMIRSTWNL